MDNSVDRKNAIRLYLTGTIGQITVIAVIVYLLRRMGIVVDYTTVIGIIAIGIGGISSAMWGSIVTVRYRKINFKRIVIEFVNIKQPVFGYLLVFMFLSIEFCYLLMGGMLQVKNWYIPVILFVKSILFWLPQVSLSFLQSVCFGGKSSACINNMINAVSTYLPISACTPDQFHSKAFS